MALGAMALAAMLWCLPSLAAGEADDPAAALRGAQERLEGERQRQRTLADDAQEHARALADARTQLITLASQAARNEGELAEISDSLALLRQEEAANLTKFDMARARMGALLGALQRLSRVPPEAALARPDSPVDILRSALLLRDTVPALRRRADELAHMSAQLTEVRQQMETQRAVAEAVALELNERRRQMTKLIAERETLSQETTAERAESARRVARLTARTTDLRQLMDRVEAERRADANAARRREAERLENERQLADAREATALRAERQNTESSPPPIPAPDTRQADGRAGGAPAEPPNRTQLAEARPPVPPSAKNPQLPIGGRIAIRFGQTDHLGAESRGAHIIGRPGAAVVAPYSGSIMYAGIFRNFGLILIVEHGNGYHSLLAGLGRIDVTVGRHVATGEPLGALPDDAEGDGPELYFELRENGQPVDPERGFSGTLGKGHG